ncbi:MAG: permease [Methanocorpusculum sp.]|nr:permease [Methanocorpusculum sp.]
MSFSEALFSSLKEFITISLELAVLFVLVSLLVGVLSVYVSKERIQRVLGTKRSFLGSILGAFFGALTPFCSCSTIPITLGLLNSGVAFSSAMSFLFASPLLNPVIISMMLVLFGPQITVAYAVIMFVAAVITGLVLEMAGFSRYLKSVVVEGLVEETGTKAERIIRYAVRIFKQMFPYLLLGAAIGALIHGFLPADFVLMVAGPDNLFAIPLAALIGIPLYIRAETILPIGAALIAKGMGLGSVVALLIGGAGLSIPEITMLSAMFQKKLLWVFIAVIFCAAVLTGIIMQVL